MLRRAGRWLLTATMIGSMACAVLLVVLWAVSHVYPVGRTWETGQRVPGGAEARSAWSAEGEFGFTREFLGHHYPLVFISRDNWMEYLRHNMAYWADPHDVGGLRFYRIPDVLLVLAIPYWMPFTLTLLIATASWLLWRRRHHRIAAGQCVQCGYDLRGSAGACPECGTPRPA